MIELERTFLVKELPDLSNCQSKEVIDVYFPKDSRHPVLRLRKNGSTFELTKKEPKDGDASEMTEETIHLKEGEFKALQQAEGKRVRKIRYYYPYKGMTAEIDVFQDELEGFVIADFEFKTREEKAAFEMPDFCLAEITHEEFTAGGMICGKTYEDIEPHLEKYNFKKLFK